MTACAACGGVSGRLTLSDSAVIARTTGEAVATSRGYNHAVGRGSSTGESIAFALQSFAGATGDGSVVCEAVVTRAWSNFVTGSGAAVCEAVGRQIAGSDAVELNYREDIVNKKTGTIPPTRHGYGANQNLIVQFYMDDDPAAARIVDYEIDATGIISWSVTGLPISGYVVVDR